MRIAEITAFHVRIPLRKTIRHALYTRTTTDSLIVHCRLHNGIEGWGEGLPRPYVTGETIESAFEQLRMIDLESRLGATFDDLGGAIQLCDALQVDTSNRNGRDCFGNSVRCALELSVLDAAACAMGTPLSSVTAALPEAVSIRQSSQQVRYGAAITSMSPLKQAVRAWQIRAYGFQQCKVKVGVSGIDDVAALKRIRHVVGQQVDIRIDVNGAWTCDNLEAKLEPLLPFGLTCIEQPVTHEQVDGLTAIRSRIETPIMLDESLCSLSDAHRAVERGTCDLFNIRLSKCGGLLNSLKIAAFAHQSKLAYQLGCQVGETGILSAAGRHFATSVGNIRYLEGSYDRFLVKERLTVQDLTFRRGGCAPALTTPGLGVDVDLQALARVAINKEHWTFK